MQLTTLGSAYDYLNTELGIFSQMTGAPWASVRAMPTMTGEQMDSEYIIGRSYSKIISPFLAKIIENAESPEQWKDKISDHLWRKFGKKWKRLYETLKADYNPIHNYDMTETRSLSKSTNDQANNSSSTSSTGNSSSTGYEYGFNSTLSDNNPSSKDANTSSDSKNVIGNASYTGSEREIETTKRSGNIGVTTSQQMIQAERDLWRWNFYEEVFRDVDSVVALKVYDMSSCD